MTHEQDGQTFLNWNVYAGEPTQLALPCHSFLLVSRQNSFREGDTTDNVEMVINWNLNDTKWLSK